MPEEQTNTQDQSGAQKQVETAKKVFVTNHGDLKGFATQSDNPRAPKANMKLRLTKTGLEKWLQKLNDAGVEAGDIDYILFAHEGQRADGDGSYCFMTAMIANAQQDSVPTL